MLVASQGAGIFRSENSGVTWQPLGLEGVNFTDLKFDPHQPRTVWAGATPYTPYNKPALRGGLWRSDDLGTTWRQLIADRGPTELHSHPERADLLLGLFEDRRLRLSRNKGETWQDFSEGLPAAAGEVAYMSSFRFQALTAVAGGWLLGNNEGGYFRRSHQDNVWTAQPRPQINQGDWYGREELNRGWSKFGRAMASIREVPGRPGELISTDWYGLYHSTDNGRSWTLRIEGIEGTVHHAFCQDPTEPGLVHGGMADLGYVSSKDGGATYARSLSVTNNIKSVDLSPLDPRRIYMVGTDSGDWRSDRLFVSVDRGQYFTLSPLEGVTSRAGRIFNSVLADPRNPMTVWIAATGPIAEGGGVYVSRDGGQRFSPLNEGLPAGEFFETDIWNIGRELAVGRDRTVLALSSRQGALYAQESGQSRWRSVPSPTSSIYEVASSPHVEKLWFIASNSNGLWRSDNAGGNWRQVLPGQVRTVVADRARAGRWVAGTDKGVLLSEDDGVNWRLLDTSLPNLVRPTVCFAGDRVLAGTLGNGLFWIPLTTSAANPIVAAPISLPALPSIPDLVVTDIRPVPANYVPGASIRYAITVRNQGIAATGNYWLGVTAGVNGQIADWGGYYANLGAGASTTITTNDGSIAPTGSFRASALVDFSYFVTESSESNNTFEVTLGASNMPDLVVDSIEMTPANVAPGVSVVYRITARNRGSVGTGPFWLGVTVDVNGRFADWGGYTVDLAAGATTTVTTNDGSIAPAGSFRVSALVDFPDYVTESSERNNTLEVALGTLSRPDLVADSVEMSPPNAAPGSTVTYRVTVRNQGSVGTGPFWLGVTVDVNGSYADWEGYDSNLVAGGSAVLVTRGVAAPAMGAKAEAFVDYPNYVTESSETNNRRSVTLR